VTSLAATLGDEALTGDLAAVQSKLARLTPDRSRRIELVDMANAIRPKTWS